MHRSSLLTATLALAAATAMHSQSAPSAPSAAGAEPRSIRIDAVVTDGQGRAIGTLGPDDFTLVENGIPQKIETATFTSKLASAGPLAPVPTPVDESDERAQERAAREPGTRVIGIYLDEFHVAAGPSTERVRHAVARFVDEQLRPSDLVVVLKPMASLTSIRFSRDRAGLREAIATFAGVRDDFKPRSPFEEQYIGRAPSTVRSARAQIVMSGLRALVARMGELEGGLSALVFVSEGFAPEGARSRERRLPDLGSLVRAAGRSRVLVYAVDPGPALPPVERAALVPAGTSGGGGTPPLTLSGAATESGGTVIGAGSDLALGLQAVTRDLDGYYVLTYRTTTPSDGRFHAVVLSAKRRDVQVRTRGGYWAPLPPELRASRTPALPLAPMRAIRRSPLIHSWFGTTIQPDGTRRAIFTWTPTGRPAQGARQGRADLVALKVTTPAGKVLFEGEVAPVQAIVGGVHRANSAVFEASPGRLQFDMTIFRADGSRLDTGTDDVDIPEVKAGPPVILQPQLFRAGSALEFRALSADANAAPLPGREFRRTEHLMLRVPAYDPSGSPVRVSAKLLNTAGSTLLELPPSGTPSGSISQFDLMLARFAPGEYAFELAAESGSGKSRQVIRFRITG